LRASGTCLLFTVTGNRRIFALLARSSAASATVATKFDRVASTSR